MDKDVDLIMINQQEQEQLRSQCVPNIILIIRNKRKSIPAMYIFQWSSSVAGSGFISKTTPLHVHHAFLYISLPIFARPSTSTCLILRFMEDVNKQRRNFISLSVLVYGA